MKSNNSQLSEAKVLSDNTLANGVSSLPTVPLDCSKAGDGVWLVKVPNYLAQKWKSAPDNCEVGKIKITQSRTNKIQKQIMFNSSEQLMPKQGEEKVPVKHKFLMAPIGSQDMYILKQKEDLTGKDTLGLIGKVIQRAECNPALDDANYVALKRETNRKLIEPVRKIQMADEFVQRQHFLPKSNHANNNDKKDKTKRLRNDKIKVQDDLFRAFNKHQYYTIKDLETITKQPSSYLKDILHELCRYNGKGAHKNTWELKEEFKQSTSATSDPKKPNTSATGTTSKAAASEEKKDSQIEQMDESDSDMDDFDEDLSDDDLE